MHRQAICLCMKKEVATATVVTVATSAKLAHEVSRQWQLSMSPTEGERNVLKLSLIPKQCTPPAKLGLPREGGSL